MSTPYIRAGRLAALCLIFGSASAAFGQTQTDKPDIDLLTRPAVFKEHANASVLLAVTTAGKRLVAVGERGIVLLSDDLGKSWRQARVPVSVALTKVQFPEPNQGWAIGHGGVVLHSMDGGANWIKQLDGFQAVKIELASAKEEAARTGEAGMHRVRDAERMVAEGADKPFLDVYFSDADHGFVVGAYGLAFATLDGGKTWRSLKGRINNPKGRHLYSIEAAGKSLYIAGEQGVFYRSNDDGQNFQEMPTPYTGTYFGVLSGRNGELVLFGLRGNAFRSTDDGANWQKIDTGLPVTLTAGERLASGAMVLVDETGRVLRSTDNGANFQPIPVMHRAAFTGVVQVADGSLVLSGIHGTTRIAADIVLGGVKK